MLSSNFVLPVLCICPRAMRDSWFPQWLLLSGDSVRWTTLTSSAIAAGTRSSGVHPSGHVASSLQVLLFLSCLKYSTVQKAGFCKFIEGLRKSLNCFFWSDFGTRAAILFGNVHLSPFLMHEFPFSSGKSAVQALLKCFQRGLISYLNTGSHIQHQYEAGGCAASQVWVEGKAPVLGYWEALQQ